jgi:hypothetical protein
MSQGVDTDLLNELSCVLIIAFKPCVQMTTRQSTPLDMTLPSTNLESIATSASSMPRPSNDGVPKKSQWLADLAKDVHGTFAELHGRQVMLVDSGEARANVDAIILDVHGLYDDLSRIVEQRNASQRDNEASGS